MRWSTPSPDSSGQPKPAWKGIFWFAAFLVMVWYFVQKDLPDLPKSASSTANAPQPTNSPQTTSPQTTNRWIRTVGTSSFDDTKTISLALPADNEIHGWPQVTFLPQLVCLCKEGKTTAYVITGMTGHLYHDEGYNGDATVTRARYDKDDAWEYVMLKSTDGKAYFFRNAIDEIKTISKKSKLVIEFTPFNGTPQEIRFTLEGINEFLPELRAQCKW
jgi:hypothetical protein